LFILVQERALAEGEERITGSIIRKTAKEDLHMIQPMIKALRNNNTIEIRNYGDISINLDELAINYKSTMELNGKVQELFKERKTTIELTRKSTVENLVLDLTAMDMFCNLSVVDIKKLCEKIIEKAPVNEEYNVLKIAALKKAMEQEEKFNSCKKEDENKKQSAESLLELYELARKNKEHPYDMLKRNGYINIWRRTSKSCWS